MKDKSSAPYIDAHSHQLSPEQEGILNIDIDTEFNFDLKALPKRSFSIGIHPWKVNSHQRNFSLIKEIAKNEYCVAIGETGLDRLHMKTFEQQKLSTLEHIELAKTLHKPLIFHCVRAYQDLYHLLKESKYHGKLLLHDYNGNEQIMSQFLRLNCCVFFSLGKRVYDPNSKMTKSLSSLPSSNILLETDDQTDCNIQQIYEKTLLLRDDLSKSKININFHEFISFHNLKTN